MALFPRVLYHSSDRPVLRRRAPYHSSFHPVVYLNVLCCLSVHRVYLKVPHCFHLSAVCPSMTGWMMKPRCRWTV